LARSRRFNDPSKLARSLCPKESGWETVQDEEVGREPPSACLKGPGHNLARSRRLLFGASEKTALFEAAEFAAFQRASLSEP